MQCLLGSNSSRRVDRSRSRSRSPRREEEKKLDNVGLGVKSRLKSVGIQMKLTNQRTTAVPRPKLTVAAVFNQDSDEEPEEMPPEAKMRMRNIGRDTPTSSGPNSFGKTKQGFSDTKKLFEKNMKEAMENALKED
ncbi:PREDICTED: PEST proteolytic signal-containing nuclear protein-like isoform X2 [Nicrophorus vespilloides]|uniref:PEST proteolytic signal-containing nuclear protein n=1 Tax=Nicrophorus vespilloides TaxID=110193 RepID=A0ABM1N6G9_NICVS|nr:PREDICTED: PEST proteolytic signal-containing nuclear protein-like isoform X2 [Nicrophorus vespilloides]